MSLVCANHSSAYAFLGGYDQSESITFTARAGVESSASGENSNRDKNANNGWRSMDWLADHELLFVVLLVLVWAFSNYGIVRLSSKKLWKPYSAIFVGLLNFLALAVLFPRVDDLRKEHNNDKKVLRERHLEQLHPVLQHESDSLKYISNMAKDIGYVIDVSNAPSKYKPMIQQMLWLDPLLSDDLKNHYREYDLRKYRLAGQMELQSQEAFVLVRDMVSSVGRPVTREDSEYEAAVSYTRACMGRGPGISLERTEYGYRFTSALRGPLGAEFGNLQIEFYIQSFESFQQLTNKNHFEPRCEILKKRADWITSEAADLSRQARVYSEQGNFKGECQFTTP
jgi:hypothetical protein